MKKKVVGLASSDIISKVKRELHSVKLWSPILILVSKTLRCKFIIQKNSCTYANTIPDLTHFISVNIWKPCRQSKKKASVKLVEIFHI